MTRQTVNIPDQCITQLKGLTRAGINPKSGNIVAAFQTLDDKEVWIEIPHSAMGKVIVGLIHASKLRLDDPALAPEDQKSVRQVFDVARSEVGVNRETNQLVVSFHTAAGLSIDFQFQREDIEKLRYLLHEQLRLTDTATPPSTHRRN